MSSSDEDSVCRKLRFLAVYLSVYHCLLHITLRMYQMCVLLSACKQVITPTETGDIMSSNFPLNYNNNEICLYTVIVPEGKQALLTMNSVELATGDELYVYDDDLAIGSPNLVYSSKDDDASYAISFNTFNSFSDVVDSFRSSGQALVLLFLSDEIETDRGFQATLSVIEGMNLKTEDTQKYLPSLG